MFESSQDAVSIGHAAHLENTELLNRILPSSRATNVRSVGSMGLSHLVRHGWRRHLLGKDRAQEQAISQLSGANHWKKLLGLQGAVLVLPSAQVRGSCVA